MTPHRLISVLAAALVTFSCADISEKPGDDSVPREDEQQNPQPGEDEGPQQDDLYEFHGLGTPEHPFILACESDFTRLSGLCAGAGSYDFYSAACYSLEADIAFSGILKPICQSGSKPFKGTFRGNGHVLRGLRIRENSSPSALFGYAGGAVISGIVLENLDISGGQLCAGVAGRIDSTSISDCHLSHGCVIAASGIDAGGIVGRIGSGSVTACSVGRENGIYGQSKNVGGIAGIVNNVPGVTNVIEGCAVYGDVCGLFCVGGITGHYIGDDAGGGMLIRNCTVSGGILTATGLSPDFLANLGGIAGWLQPSGKVQILNCMASPLLIRSLSIDSRKKGGIGGIVGYVNTPTEIRHCASTVSADCMLNGGAPVTGAAFPSYGSLYGLAATDSAVSDCLYCSDLRSGEPLSVADAGSCRTCSPSEWSGAASALSSTGEEAFSRWLTGTDGKPALDGVPPDLSAGFPARKRVSVIGDSISSYTGFVPSGCAAFYPRTDGSGFRNVSGTYWWKLAYDHMSHATFEMNISQSATAVARTTGAAYAGEGWYGHDFCRRFVDYGGVGRPDLIIIYGGTNDRAHKADPLAPGIDITSGKTPSAAGMNAIFGPADAADSYEKAVALTDTDFCSAYCKLIRLCQTKHPDARILCIIGDYVFDNMRICMKQMADHFGCRYIDFLPANGHTDNAGITKLTGCHPDENGMAYMAGEIYSQLASWLEAD